MVLITGDLHGGIDMEKLVKLKQAGGDFLTRSDYVIICGDFGLVWDTSDEEIRLRRWLERCSWTTLWIDGNHENFDLLNDYPIEDWNGGKVQYITPHILHLCRGSVFTLDDMTFFAFGGAESHDKPFRTYGESMWLEELPSPLEMEEGSKALDAVGWRVDYVLSHSLPQRIQRALFPDGDYPENVLTAYFDEIDSRLDYRMWFSGHYHCSAQYQKRYYPIYDDIIVAAKDGIERIYPE